MRKISQVACGTGTGNAAFHRHHDFGRSLVAGAIHHAVHGGNRAQCAFEHICRPVTIHLDVGHQRQHHLARHFSRFLVGSRALVAQCMDQLRQLEDVRDDIVPVAGVPVVLADDAGLGNSAVEPVRDTDVGLQRIHQVFSIACVPDVIGTRIFDPCLVSPIHSLQAFAARLGCAQQPARHDAFHVGEFQPRRIGLGRFEFAQPRNLRLGKRRQGKFAAYDCTLLCNIVCGELFGHSSTSLK